MILYTFTVFKYTVLPRTIKCFTPVYDRGTLDINYPFDNIIVEII